MKKKNDTRKKNENKKIQNLTKILKHNHKIK